MCKGRTPPLLWQGTASGSFQMPDTYSEEKVWVFARLQGFQRFTFLGGQRSLFTAQACGAVRSSDSKGTEKPDARWSSGSLGASHSLIRLSAHVYPCPSGAALPGAVLKRRAFGCSSSAVTGIRATLPCFGGFVCCTGMGTPESGLV